MKLSKKMVLVPEERYNEYMAWEQRKQVNSKEDSTKMLETLKYSEKRHWQNTEWKRVTGKATASGSGWTGNRACTKHRKCQTPGLRHTLSVSRDKLNIKRSGEKTKERYRNKQSGGGLPPGWIHFRQYRTPGSVKH